MDFHAADGDFDEMIVENIKYYKWERFVQSPGDFCPELVLEFYANLHKDKNESVVRGTTVNFSSESIKVFGLEIVNDDLTQLMIKTPNWEEVEEKLCPFGANWKFYANGSRKHLKGRNVSYCDRPWVSLISSRLSPYQNNSVVLASRVLILYAICTRMPIDVGKMINLFIKDCVDNPNVRSIFFPSTITNLLKKFDVYPTRLMPVSSYSEMINKYFWDSNGETDGPKRKSRQEEKPRQARLAHSAQLMVVNQLAAQVDGLLHQFIQLAEKIDKLEEKMENKTGKLEELIKSGLRRVEKILMYGI